MIKAQTAVAHFPKALAEVSLFATKSAVLFVLAAMLWQAVDKRPRPQAQEPQELQAKPSAKERKACVEGLLAERPGNAERARAPGSKLPHEPAATRGYSCSASRSLRPAGLELRQHEGCQLAKL